MRILIDQWAAMCRAFLGDDAAVIKTTTGRGRQPKTQPTGRIGVKGSRHRRQIAARVIDGRAWTYHATKGWRSRRIAPLDA